MKRDKLSNGTPFDPPLRMTTEGRNIHISIALPGVSEEQIRIDLEGTTFTVSILNTGTTLEKDIQVPRGTRFSKKKFADGVLDISLEKPVS
jgi:HSP20 family molecular chaperone IbpA